MKVTFYCDVPDYWSPQLNLYASTHPGPGVMPGWRRVAFQVDLPTRTHDDVAPPVQSFEVPKTGDEAAR